MSVAAKSGGLEADDEAHYDDRRQFGNQPWLKEAGREMSRFRSLETLLQDLRYSLRMMVRNPSFNAVAINTLTIGIGSCTAIIFSVVFSVMLRPLPYHDPGRLCLLWKSDPQKG